MDDQHEMDPGDSERARLLHEVARLQKALAETQRMLNLSIQCERNERQRHKETWAKLFIHGLKCPVLKEDLAFSDRIAEVSQRGGGG